jgi:hypothetical protein
MRRPIASLLVLLLSLSAVHAQAPNKPVKLGVLNDQSG